MPFKNPSTRRRIRLCIMGYVTLAGFTGCGGRTLYPVKGKVEYKNGADVSVLARGRVLFDPADPDAVKVSARGEIQPDGTFAMGTYKEGDGVVPGKYRVMLSPPPFFGGRDATPPQLLDERFQDFEASGLEITVAGAVTDFTIIVEK